MESVGIKIIFSFSWWHIFFPQKTLQHIYVLRPEHRETKILFSTGV